MGGIKMVWFIEYKHCSCSFISNFKKDAPNHCPRHFSSIKSAIKIEDKNFKKGYVET